MKKLFFSLLLLLTLVAPATTFADRKPDEITDWYIKDFHSDITIHHDGSVAITEKILADCGNLPDKHGIFRTLPLFYQETFWRRIPTPVQLNSITDFAGNNIHYEEINQNDTVTWKIGDPYQTVNGVNEYEIKYTVANAIRTRNPNFDEFYWNLNGNFWDIETDAFTATIHFPFNIPNAAQHTSSYIGAFGATYTDGITSTWQDARTLEVHTTTQLYVEEGVTTSVTFPKSLITPTNFTWNEMYGQWSLYLWPLYTLFFCVIIWFFWGRDPLINKAIMPQYEPPTGWDVMELAMIQQGGKFENKFATAAILSMASRKILAIENIDSDLADARLVQLPFPKNEKLSEGEEILMQALFQNRTSVQIADLKYTFTSTIDKISSRLSKKLIEQGIFTKAGKIWAILFAIAAFLSISAIFFLSNDLGEALALLASSAIFFIFAAIMPKVTAKGNEIRWHMKGFLLFMKTAEKHRQIFFEQEHLFEKLLPYAIVFGFVGLWVKAMQTIYGEQMQRYTNLYWGSTTPTLGFGSLDSFTSNLNSLTSKMSSTISATHSSSGSSGGGFSGGGGGGGGGGGW